MKFNKRQVSELITEIAMGPFGSNIKVDCFVDAGIPVLNGSNLEGITLKEEQFRFVTKEKSDSLKKANASRGDIVITHRGTLGQIVYIPQNSKYEKYVISQSQFRLRCNNEIFPEYFVYYFHTPIGQHKILSNASQVGVPALARPSTTFQKLEIEVPDKITQKKIVSFLNSLEDKIALNNSINKNLEKQADAIFKKEFLSFGEFPNDWKISNLLGIADYLNGLAMQKFRPDEGELGYPVLKIKELRQGICDKESEQCSRKIKQEYIIHDGDVVFSWSGSLLVDFWCGGICGLNQHLFKVSSKIFDKWFYYSWTKYHLRKFVSIAADMATTMGHIKREELEKANVFIPSKQDYERIGSLLKPIYDSIITNRIQNRKLSNLRDNLLPKLMSGEIDIENIYI